MFSMVFSASYISKTLSNSHTHTQIQTQTHTRSFKFIYVLLVHVGEWVLSFVFEIITCG